MFSNPVENLIEPVWRRFARCAVCAVVGIGAVIFLVAVLTFLHPVLPQPSAIFNSEWRCERLIEPIQREVAKAVDE